MMSVSLRSQIIAVSFIVLVVVIMTGCVPDPEIPAVFDPGRDPELEESIIKELSEINPEAVPLYQEATRVMDESDYSTALDLYEELANLVPEFPTVYRRLSYLESIRGNNPTAIELARTAVDLDPNGYNQSSLAITLLDDGSPKAVREAYNLATSAVEKLPDDEQAVMALMLTSWMAYEDEVLRQSTERMLELAPGYHLPHYIAGLLAASDRRWFLAERELIISEGLGMPPEAIQEVMDSGLAWTLTLIRSIIWGTVAIICWLIGLGILYLVGKSLSNKTINTLSSEKWSVESHISPEERNLRSIYRGVISFLSIYFYISIPFMIILVLVIGGVAYYIFSLIGFIPVYIAAGLGLILIVSLFIMLGSLFRKVKSTPPGILLDRDRIPMLWSMNDEVARDLEVRSVDAIYLTSDVWIGVNETGNLAQKIRGSGVRNLMLGMGVLPGLNQEEFAAVLAHEYGHFSNKDTAGGNLAHRVHGSLDQMARQMGGTGTAIPFNPVWLFVINYLKIYVRVAHGAKRLQEVLADRYATRSMGSKILIAGLTNIVKESIRFNLKANQKIKESLEKKVGLNNLYNLPMNDDLNSKFNEVYAERLKEETSDFDSHPALQERIDRIGSYRIPDKQIRNGDQPVLDLIPEAEELQQKMTLEITDQIPGL